MQTDGDFHSAAGHQQERFEIHTGNVGGTCSVPTSRGTEAAPTLNAIRYGLAAIKNVGEAAMAMAIRERDQRGEFSSLEDFCTRLDSRVANRKMLESLIKAGAFDFTGRDRAELFACIDESLNASAIAQRDRAAGQVSLFDEQTHAATAARRQPIRPWNEHEKLSYEKELLGFYVSGHPLDAYADVFAAKNYRSIASLGELDDRAQFKIAGAIVEVEKKFTKERGQAICGCVARRSDGRARGGCVERGLSEGLGYSRARARC